MRLFLSSVLLLGSLVVASPTSAQTLYVLGGGEIVEADTLLTPPTTVIPSISTGITLAVDADAGFIFWLEGITVRRANIDGTASMALTTSPGTSPQQMAVHPVRQRIYWADPGVIQVRHLDYSGANPTALGGFSFVTGFAVDATLDRVYTALGPPGVIGHYDGDLTNASETLLIPGLSNPQKLGLDTVNQRVYWVNGSGQLQRCNADGTGLATLTTLPGGAAQVRRIAVDGADGFLYIGRANGVTRHDLDGQSPTNVYTGVLIDFALVPAPPPPLDPTFVRGDCNADATKNIADAIFLLTGLFGGGDLGSCDDACDMNDDGLLNIADAVAGLNALFGGGVTPPPTDACGLDPTDTDPLDCVAHAGCP